MKTPGRHATGRRKENSPARARRPTEENIAVAAPLDELAQRNDGQLRFQPVDPAERQQFGQRGQEYRKYLQQRQQLEANAASAPGGDPAAAAGRHEGRSRDLRSWHRPPISLAGSYAPPQRHQVLKPDFQVQPQPRTRGPGQSQRQGVNQGNRQGPPAGQFQGQGTDRGNNRRGAQRQGAAGGGGAPGQQPSGVGGQNPGSQQNPPADESQEKK